MDIISFARQHFFSTVVKKRLIVDLLYIIKSVATELHDCRYWVDMCLI